MKFISTLVSGITTAMTTLTLVTSVGMAQMAEVPTPNAKGDFITAKVQGNRGLYNNIHWLVVDPESLNCRNTPEGTVKVKLVTGAIINAIFSNNGKGDAIVLKNGQPWMKVESINPAGYRFNSGVCYVRANSKYIAPINGDYLDIFKKE
ncbi:hypothetical protein PCC9214_04729 [Planktothrix tepida]|uniref:Uncharacterized protein n=2 Tax=Planktothrix TaxID=54304 RepID=A0A1J1LMC0_9CYAN|nr:MULTISPECIES: hypothetical protein [Planktothrix]CAD5922063.1 hypothetical protein NO713_00728 [Planktothrix pseudagardhii]CAD5980960.1 hypothetical protein PCC9214_04729 [Planktothrix tepida]CUR33717.1 conserved exported hypothetical protein [Planktothrix tepida PCC 9214]